MPKLAYIDKRFKPASLAKIELAQRICDEYARQGYALTLRQLYYQFVARDIIPNKQTEYDNLGSLINDARLAGLIDWSHLEDRTRNVRELSHWDEPADILDSAASSYRVALWDRQPNYCEVWIEKDALVGVIESVCLRNDVPYFSCRGYTSQSEMWQAAQRLVDQSGRGERPVHIIHLGDHDPSGIDMTRDITDRLTLFLEPELVEDFEVHRIALNFDQVTRYKPPPNPAKLTDSRADGYIALHGRQSWELDALTPQVIEELIADVIDELRDEELWDEDIKRMNAQREQIKDVARQFREGGAL